MADSDISGLGAASAIAASNVFPVQQGGASVLKATAEQLRAFINGGAIFKACNSLNTVQSISPNSWTKITAINTSLVDTAGWFSVTNQKYTPAIAGWYEFGGSLIIVGADDQTKFALIVSKNSVSLGNGDTILLGRSTGSGTNNLGEAGVGFLYMNGSTDYVELQAYHTSSAAKNTDSPALSITFFGRLLFAA